jgi:hypothetical protein
MECNTVGWVEPSDTHHAVASSFHLMVRASIAVAVSEMMEVENNHDRSKLDSSKRPRRLISRTRVVMILLLIVAIPIFIALSNKAVRENADAIQQIFGR